MAAKKVKIEANMGEGFKVECLAGNHTVYIDQPTSTGGENSGPTPLEYLFISLAGCFCAIGRIIANQQRIQLRGMKVMVDGELDTDGLLGTNTKTRVGFSEITVLVGIDADLSGEEKEQFLSEIEKRCPVSDNISNSTKVEAKLSEV